MILIPASTAGGGSNAAAGRRRESENSHHGSHPSEASVLGHTDARFLPASYWTIRSARRSGEVGSSSSRRRIALLRVNGMFQGSERCPRHRHLKDVALDHRDIRSSIEPPTEDGLWWPPGAP